MNRFLIIAVAVIGLTGCDNNINAEQSGAQVILSTDAEFYRYTDNRTTVHVTVSNISNSSLYFFRYNGERVYRCEDQNFSGSDTLISDFFLTTSHPSMLPHISLINEFTVDSLLPFSSLHDSLFSFGRGNRALKFYYNVNDHSFETAAITTTMFSIK